MYDFKSYKNYYLFFLIQLFEAESFKKPFGTVYINCITPQVTLVTPQDC